MDTVDSCSDDQRNKDPTVMKAYSLVLPAAAASLKLSPAPPIRQQQAISKVSLFADARDSEPTITKAGYMTILGFGSLLSKRSSQMTFPDLQNFRLGRVRNFRRVFGHSTSIFHQRGIANKETLEMSSLSAEYEEGQSFICTVFEVPDTDMMEDGVPSMAFLEREEEFDIFPVPFEDLSTGMIQENGILCTRSSDQTYLSRWGKERFQEHFEKFGISTIWNWAKDSGLRPCPMYLRHCVLAARSMGEECYHSFLDETFLVDRKTTIRDYLEHYPNIMEMEIPEEFAIRYGG
jgi:hypothetical protein